MLKKILLYCLILFWVTTTIVYAWDFYYDYEATSPWTDTTEIAKIIDNDAVEKQSSVLYKIRKMFWLTWWLYSKDDNNVAINYIKKLMNMALWFVSFIALVVTLYAFYLMFFSKQEEWMEKAKSILKWVAIAIAVMWLSYFIVSFIIYIYTSNTWVS